MTNYVYSGFPDQPSLGSYHTTISTSDVPSENFAGLLWHEDSETLEVMYSSALSNDDKDLLDTEVGNL